MTAHNWPIGEPIETDESEVIATIHHVDEEGFMSGTTAHYGEFVRVALWNERGESITTRNTNLIPPKRKPRTVGVWVCWREPLSETKASTFVIENGATYHIITHPDDIPPPITRGDVETIVYDWHEHGTTNHKLVGDIMALIESRQNNSV